MSNFFKTITKGVGDAVERVQLDAAISEIVDGYDRKVNAYMSAGTDLSSEDAERLEKEWMYAANAMYDERALKITGRRVPANWHEGKDLIVVRKRMLNRQLDQRKGRLFEGVKNSHATMVWRLSDLKFSCERSIESFEMHMRDHMPILPATLHKDYDEMISVLQTKINEEYPGGLSRFQADSVTNNGVSAWHEINVQAHKVLEDLLAINAISIEQTKNEMLRKVVSKLVNDLRVHAREMAEQLVGGVVPDTPVIPIAEAVESATSPSTMPLLDFLNHTERLEFAQKIRSAAIKCIVDVSIDGL
jgi:hypothetical protein